MYKIVYLDQVAKDFQKLDKPTIKKIFTKIETHLAKDPKGLGKALKGNFKGYWRYRFGDYLVIYRICEEEILITVLRISHRKEIYR